MCSTIVGCVPRVPIEIAKQYWAGHDATHCKNLFFRNHKGNQHYLVLLDCNQNMDIHSIEKILKQGKLSFASAERMNRYLGVQPGSVTPFGLINDATHHVIVFIDSNLQHSERLSFHPCIKLLVLQQGASARSAFMIGNGWWRWRMYDYMQYATHSHFDDLILKVFQYIGVKEDKNFFRVSGKQIYAENEDVVFDAELYNANYELVK